MTNEVLLEKSNPTVLKPCIINGEDYFGNMQDVLEKNWIKNVSDVKVSMKNWELGNNMKVTFKLNWKNQWFFLDYGTMLTNFVPKWENVRNTPSHEHVWIMNAILDFVRKNDLKLSAIESTTQNELNVLNSDIQTA